MTNNNHDRNSAAMQRIVTYGIVTLFAIGALTFCGWMVQTVVELRDGDIERRIRDKENDARMQAIADELTTIRMMLTSSDKDQQLYLQLREELRSTRERLFDIELRMDRLEGKE